jgi:hypothetical protein
MAAATTDEGTGGQGAAGAPAADELVAGKYKTAEDALASIPERETLLGQQGEKIGTLEAQNLELQQQITDITEAKAKEAAKVAAGDAGAPAVQVDPAYVGELAQEYVRDGWDQTTAWEKAQRQAEREERQIQRSLEPLQRGVMTAAAGTYDTAAADAVTVLGVEGLAPNELAARMRKEVPAEVWANLQPEIRGRVAGDMAKIMAFEKGARPRGQAPAVIEQHEAPTVDGEGQTPLAAREAGLTEYFVQRGFPREAAEKAAKRAAKVDMSNIPEDEPCL